MGCATSSTSTRSTNYRPRSLLLIAINPVALQGIGGRRFSVIEYLIRFASALFAGSCAATSSTSTREPRAHRPATVQGSPLLIAINPVALQGVGGRRFSVIEYTYLIRFASALYAGVLRYKLNKHAIVLCFAATVHVARFGPGKDKGTRAPKLRCRWLSVFEYLIRFASALFAGAALQAQQAINHPLLRDNRLRRSFRSGRGPRNTTRACASAALPWKLSKYHVWLVAHGACFASIVLCFATINHVARSAGRENVPKQNLLYVTHSVGQYHQGTLLFTVNAGQEHRLATSTIKATFALTYVAHSVGQDHQGPTLSRRRIVEYGASATSISTVNAGQEHPSTSNNYFYIVIEQLLYNYVTFGYKSSASTQKIEAPRGHLFKKRILGNNLVFRVGRPTPQPRVWWQQQPGAGHSIRLAWLLVLFLAHPACTQRSSNPCESA